MSGEKTLPEVGHRKERDTSSETGNGVRGVEERPFTSTTRDGEESVLSPFPVRVRNGYQGRGERVLLPQRVGTSGWVGGVRSKVH